MKNKKVIGIDFDHTIAIPDGDGELKPIKNSIEALKSLKDAGWHIVIHTCRTTVALRDDTLEEELDSISDFLNSHKIPFDEIWEKPKLIADLYIDDRAIHFDGDWNKTINKVSSYEKK